MFKPLGNRILVQPDESEKETKSGIIVVSKAEERPATGKVVVGNNLVNEGDRVLFSRFGYDEVKMENKTYYVVNDFNILGILK